MYAVKKAYLAGNPVTTQKDFSGSAKMAKVKPELRTTQKRNTVNIRMLARH